MSARRQRLPEQGYTLMELAVAAVPLALIALSIFGAFSFTVAFTRRGEQQVEAMQQARLALQFMAQELREASTFPGAIIIWSRDEGAAQDGLGFLAARVNGPGRPFITDPTGGPRWQQAVYYLHDAARGELRRITRGPSTLASPASWDEDSRNEGRVLAKQVTRFRVKRQGDLLTITLTVAVNPGNPPAEATLETAVRPRN